MAHYDESVLQAQADQLYKKAAYIALWTAVGYFVRTLLISSVVGAALAFVPAVNIPGGAIMAGVLYLSFGIGLSGLAAGRAKAFHLKVEAQQILCLRQIEINSRASCGASI